LNVDSTSGVGCSSLVLPFQVISGGLSIISGRSSKRSVVVVDGLWVEVERRIVESRVVVSCLEASVGSVGRVALSITGALGRRSPNGKIQGRKRKRHPRKIKINARISAKSHRLVRVRASRVMGGKPLRFFADDVLARFEEVEFVEEEFTRASLKRGLVVEEIIELTIPRFSFLAPAT
jgi:hypothetical protein